MTALSVLIVTRSLPFHIRGGMESVVWDLAHQFQKAGLCVTICTTSCPGLPARSTRDGIEIVCLPVKSGRYSEGWWRQSAKAYQAEFQQKAQIVFSISAGAMAIARLRNPGSRAPLLITQCHGTTWSEIVSKLKLPKLKEWLKALYVSNRLWRDRGYRRFDAIVSVGTRVTSDLHKMPTRQIVGNVPVYEIPNGIDTGLFAFNARAREHTRARYAIPPGASLALSVSRLHVQKGLQHALTGFAQAFSTNKSLRFLIVGTGPFEKNLKDQCSRLSLGDVIIFAGDVDREDLPAIYSAADFFISTPTRIEAGITMAVMEALSCGLPAIVSRHLLQVGQQDLYPVDPLNHAVIAEQIQGQAASVADNGRDCLLAERFRLSGTAARYIELFETLLNKTA